MDPRPSSNGTVPVLDIRDLTVAYRTTRGDHTAVKGVNLTVNRGEILGIAGESGCGKSTLATSVLRLLRAPGYVVGGSAIFRARKGEPCDLLTVGQGRIRTIRWENISYLPQGSMNSLNPVIRVRDQFVDVIKAHSQLGRSEIQARIPSLLDAVGLDPSVARMYAHELSGGMKQRVLTAMAMALEPDLLIADEPTTALDVTVQRLVMQNLADLRDLGVTVLLITHDMGVHAQLADRVAVMYRGEMVEVSEVRQVFKAPKHAYTQRLIASIPTLDVYQRRRKAQERV